MPRMPNMDEKEILKTISQNFADRSIGSSRTLGELGLYFSCSCCRPLHHRGHDAAANRKAPICSLLQGPSLRAYHLVTVTVTVVPSCYGYMLDKCVTCGHAGRLPIPLTPAVPVFNTCTIVVLSQTLISDRKTNTKMYTNWYT